MDFETYLRKIRDNRFLPVPASEKIYTGGDAGNFLQVGIDTLRSLVTFGKVTPSSRVLEIGSGIGRVALPLTQWLEGEGEYTGVEIVKDGVDWCAQNIGAHYPRFRFLHLDIYNEYYNPNGTQKIGDLPLPAGHFDIAVFCSVFTHLVADDTAAYLKLLARTLKPGGLVWGTWFMMDDEARALVLEGKTTLKFNIDGEQTFFLDAERKSTLAVAYERPCIERLFADHGFTVDFVDTGLWCARDKAAGGYQDLVIARLA
jgi:SAM-dependent methyltransferase